MRGDNRVEPTNDSRAFLARQLRLHLDSLRAAGIEFLPIGPPLAFVPVAQPPTATQVPAPVLLPELAPAPRPSLDPVREAMKQGQPVLPVAPPIQVTAPSALFEASAPAVPESAADRRRELTVLTARVASCDRCPELFATRTQTVFGVGPVDPEICFVGEAPGADEDATGEPFVGRAGQLLNKIIAACGFKREEVYICNTIKCRPPNNRTPTPDERSHCREYFDRQLALVRPKYLVCLGGTAAQNVLGTTLGITKLRGRVHKYQDTPVVCTFHPSYLLRTEAAKKDTWEDMKMLLRTMGRPIPGAKS